MELKGLIGAYAMFENVGGETFVDMATMTTSIAVPQGQGETAINELLSEPDRLLETISGHPGFTWASMPTRTTRRPLERPWPNSATTPTESREVLA